MPGRRKAKPCRQYVGMSLRMEGGAAVAHVSGCALLVGDTIVPVLGDAKGAVRSAQRYIDWVSGANDHLG